MFVPVGEHVSSLFTTDDLEIAASRLPENSAAMLILWENLWVADLRKALVDAGGELVERAQIAPEVLEEFEAGTRCGLGSGAKARRATTHRSQGRRQHHAR